MEPVASFLKPSGGDVQFISLVVIGWSTASGQCCNERFMLRALSCIEIRFELYAATFESADHTIERQLSCFVGVDRR